MAEPAMKKYRGEGASETLIVEAALIEKRPKFIGLDWDSIFQICSIKLLDLGVKKSTQIYGTITLHHKWGKWKLYDVQKGNAQAITAPGDVPINHPTFGIQPFDPLVITFELEGEFAQANEATLTWMPLDPRDEIATYTLTRELFSMQVRFISFECAVLANIQIYILNNCNTCDEQEVYGSIHASFTEMHSSVPFLMFEKKEPIDYVSVKMGGAVPLLRPCIAVPRKNDLQIHVHLNTVSSCPIAGGIIKICPKRGTWEGVLGKENEHILQVVANVQFFDIEEHESTIKVREDWC